MGKERWVSTCNANTTYGIVSILPVAAMHLHIFLYSLTYTTFGTILRDQEKAEVCAYCNE